MPRRSDPNAGKAPGGPGYVEPADGREEAACDHAFNHLGGTMYPWQEIPDFTPNSFAFDEEIGGCSFGGGSAPVDFQERAIEWSCP